jgi:peptidoglycan/LPS O-acetylase OafA/YrhL
VDEMKKVFLVLLFALVLLPAMALAVETQLPTDLLSWPSLGALGVAAGLTVYIVQLLKLPLDKVLGHVPTRVAVYVIALVILLAAQVFVPGLGGLTWENGILCVFNAVLVALAAMSTYEVTIRKVEEKKAEIAASVSTKDNLPDVTN